LNLNIRLTSKNSIHLIIILHIHHTCRPTSFYVGLSHHSFVLLYTVFIHWCTAPFEYLLYFRNISWRWQRFSAETCRVYNKQMNVRTFMLLYWSNNQCKLSNTHRLPPTFTMTRAHCKCFLHPKSTSCSHISLPTLHTTSCTHISLPTLHTTSCTHISLPTLHTTSCTNI
jgi:hypothetical protein